jgi:hypothetical protein
VVTFTNRRYGIDFLSDRIRIAGRTSAAGRITVDSLHDYDAADFNSEMVRNDGDYYFSIPEKEAIIKWITIVPEGNLDPVKLIQFEMAGMLADNDENYYFDCYYSDPKSRNLAIAYNRNLIERKIKKLQEKIPKPAGFRLRSLAMASAYNNYCLHESGQHICLMDISSHSCSYCFLKENNPILIGGFENGIGENEVSEENSKKFALDLSAILQYELSKLARDGYSIPLSSIIISGPAAVSDLPVKIEERMKVKSIPPRLKKELFDEKIYAEAGKYLISLGLTVDS